MTKTNVARKHSLDAAHYFACERSTNGRWRYQVRRGDDKLSRRLFNTECKARGIADVEAHAREELRLYVEREAAAKVAG